MKTKGIQMGQDLGTQVLKEPGDLRGGKDSLEREDVKQILEQVKFVL